MSPLGQRVTTAVLLAPLAVAAILLLPTPWFAFLLGAVFLVAAWEWAALAGLGSGPQRVAATGLSALALLGTWGLLATPGGVAGVLLAGVGWWLAATVLVVARQRGGTALPASGALKLAIGLLVLVPAWSAMVALHRQPAAGPVLVLLLLVVIWSADTAAFFAGRRYGRTRLASRISPNKSWEGAWAGVGAAVLAAALADVLLGLSGGRLALLALLAGATALGSIVGDLLESLLKRDAGLKDSGAVLPGHGGMLDRIDSLTSAAPLFAAGLYGMGRLT